MIHKSKRQWSHRFRHIVRGRRKSRRRRRDQQCSMCAPDARVNSGFRAGERASTLSKVFININWTLIRPPLAPGLWTRDTGGGEDFLPGRSNSSAPLAKRKGALYVVPLKYLDKFPGQVSCIEMWKRKDSDGWKLSILNYKSKIDDENYLYYKLSFLSLIFSNYLETEHRIFFALVLYIYIII